MGTPAGGDKPDFLTLEQAREVSDALRFAADELDKRIEPRPWELKDYASPSP